MRVEVFGCALGKKWLLVKCCPTDAPQGGLPYENIGDTRYGCKSGILISETLLLLVVKVTLRLHSKK